MFSRSGFILVVVYLFSFIAANQSSNTSLQQKTQNNAKAIVSLDTLRTSISLNGWNISLLERYHHSLLNLPIDLEAESDKIKNLPGSFEKIFLYSIVLKRQGKFSEMFDTLLAAFDFHPSFYPYFDELAFAALATGRVSFLENLLMNTQKIGAAQLKYLSGLLLSASAKQKDALTAFQQADSLEPNDKNILLKISNVYKSLGNYQSSAEYLGKIKKLSADNTTIKPKLLLAEGTLFYLSNNTKKAEEFYKKALDAANQIGDKISQSKAFINLAICFDASGNFEDARIFFKRGIITAEEVNDLESLALGYSELGVSCTFTNELVEAKKSYLKSYELYKKSGNSVRLALLSSNIGKLYLSFFDYASALKCFEEGIQFAGDDKRSQVLNLIGLADVYSNLSNYSKAIKYYREAQKLSAEMKEVSLLTEISTGLGALNFNLDRFSNSEFYYQYALELQTNSSNLYFSADICHKLGLIYFHMDSLTAAETYFKRSIEYSASSKNYYAAALSYGDIAELYYKTKRYSETVNALAKAKSIAVKHNWEHLLAQQNILLGNMSAEKKNFEQAKNYYQNALHLAQSLNDFNLRILAYHSLGKLYYKANFIEAAESFYKSGISLIEDVSRPLFEESEVQIAYFNSQRELYDSYAQLLLNKKRYKEAFEIIDKSRSRNTMQNLLNLKLTSVIKDENQIENLYELDWMIHSGLYNDTQTDSLKVQLQLLKTSLIEKHDELKSIIEPWDNKVLDVQKTLLPGENFISMYSTNLMSYIFLITNNDFKSFEINATASTISNLIKQISPYFEKEAGSSYFFNKDLFAFNAKASYELYTNIFKSVIENIPQNEKLIFSPSKEIIELPIEFLITRYDSVESNYDYTNKKFLIEDYSISYSPSASVYIEEVQNYLSNDKKILIVGDPSLDAQSEEFAERRGLLEDPIKSERGLALLPLKYSTEEVNKISRIIKADRILTNKDATETNFKQKASLSRIIHLSTHSLLYEKQPLILFSNFYDPENDGFLEASEIVQLNLNSDLVVLSSCSSGLGEIDASEGIIGMTKSFFHAGVKSTVVSLWEVNDKYTSELMTIFYRKLSEGYDKSESLRMAKIEFIKTYSANPYFWAAFVLYGNINKIEIEQTSSVSKFFIVIICLILISLLVLYFKQNKKLTQKISNHE